MNQILDIIKAVKYIEDVIKDVGCEITSQRFSALSMKVHFHIMQPLLHYNSLAEPKSIVMKLNL